MKVFVYGTLRKGQGNHSLLSTAEYLRDESLPGFDMYNVGWFPAVVRGTGVIIGEVYEIDEDTLEALHALEGYDEDYPEESLYIPELEFTEYDALVLYIWNRDMEGLTLIESGDWTNRETISFDEEEAVF